MNRPENVIYETERFQSISEPTVTWYREASMTGKCIDVLVFEFDNGVALEIHGRKAEHLENWILVTSSDGISGAEIVKAFKWGRANRSRIDAMFLERSRS